jgi:hypothetical protein
VVEPVVVSLHHNIDDYRWNHPVDMLPLPSSPFRKLSLCLLATLLGTMLGDGLGFILDRGLWELSYDYVYLEAYGADHGWRLGLLLGSLYGATATLGLRPLIAPLRLLWNILIAATAIFVLGLVIALLASMCVRWDLFPLVDATADLSPRQAFCSSWVIGTGYTAWIVTGYGAIRLWQQRHHWEKSASSGRQPCVDDQPVPLPDSDPSALRV